MVRLPLLLPLLLATACQQTAPPPSEIPSTPLPRTAQQVAPADAGLEEEDPWAWDGGEPGLQPPTAAELESWLLWEAEVADAEEQLLESDGRGTPVEPPATRMRELAGKSGLSLERALVIRERAWSVLAERARLLHSRAVLAGLEHLAGGNHSKGLRRQRREAAEDVRRCTRAAESRATYGDAWVNALLRKEARLMEVYRAAAARAGRR